MPNTATAEAGKSVPPNETMEVASVHLRCRCRQGHGSLMLFEAFSTHARSNASSDRRHVLRVGNAGSTRTRGGSSRRRLRT